MVWTRSPGYPAAADAARAPTGRTIPLITSATILSPGDHRSDPATGPAIRIVPSVTA